MKGAPAFTVIPALAVLVGLAAFAHARALELRGKTPVDAHTFVPSPRVGQILSLGENELLADLAWVKTLVYYGDGLSHDTGMPDVDELIALMNQLDPKFRRPYAWGAYATTFRKRTATQEEYRSSVEILRRGVVAFPTDWEMAWLLGVRLSLDIKAETPEEQGRIREEGAMYIERAMRLPHAPSDLPLLAASMRTRLGQKERAVRELREMVLTTEDPAARAKLQARYAALINQPASSELENEARKLDSAWQATVPYAPRTTYILLGPRPPVAVDLGALVRGEELDVATDGTSVAGEHD